MADAERTLSQLLADILDPNFAGTGLIANPPVSTSAPYGRGGVNLQVLRNLIQALHKIAYGVLGSRVVGNSGLQSSDGASQTAAGVYQIDMTAGVVLIGGVAKLLAALNDKDLLSPSDIKSYKLAGTAAAALTDGGKTYEVALVVYNVSGVPTLYGVFGAEAADGAEVAPTTAQIKAAMAAAAPTGIDLSQGVVVGRILIQRTTKVTWVVGGTVAENDTFAITVNDIESEITADGDDVAADIADKLRTDLTTKLGSEDVTVSGATVNVIVTGDVGTLFTFSSEKSSTLGTLTETQADLMTFTHTNGSTDASLAAERSAGSLWIPET